MDEIKINTVEKKMAQKKVDSGLTSSVDLLEFELRENELSLEKKQLTQKHIEIHQSLKNLFGKDLEDQQFHSLNYSSVRNLNRLNDSEFEVNLEIEKNELLLQKSLLARKEVFSEFLPSLDLIYKAGKITPNNSLFSKSNEYSGALLLTIPLFSGLNSVHHLNATEKDLSSQSSLKNQNFIHTNVQLEILKNKINEITSLYEVNELRTELTKKYFDRTLAEYKKGIKNSPDVVHATEQMFQSQKKKIEYLNELEGLKVKLSTFGRIKE